MAENFIQYDPKTRQILCRGDWDLSHLPHLRSSFTKITLPSTGDVTINGQSIKRMDSSGAWIICEWQKALSQKGISLHLEQFSDEFQTLLKLVQDELHKGTAPPISKKPNVFASIGKYTVTQLIELQEYFDFIGRLFFETLRISPQLHRWRIDALTTVIYRTGYQALPIIAVLSFLIGVVLTYQMGLQLKNYGANIYIVDLIGLSVLREFGPLITAIMVSGRTGSAFTAQLGMMKLTQEIDALDTMGVTPAELLLLPRIIGLFIALPLLTMWSDIFGVIGGMTMSNNMLHISWYDFLERFSRVIPLKTLLLGLGKTPVFALIIASIGCFQGMQVKNSAESVGLNTTRSVVLSIFFIIVADAVFSIIFSKLKL